MLSFLFLRATLHRLCGLFCVLIATGCGRVQNHSAPSSSTLGDTVRVIAQETTIVVPAPQGMADVMAIAGRAPMVGRNGDVVWGMFQPRERVREALRPGYHPDVEVMLAVSSGSSVPASTFDAGCQSWRDAASRNGSPAGARVAKALARWRDGARDGDMGLGDPPAGDRFVVAAESPEPWMCRLLTVGRSPASDGGITDVICETKILVRGHILSLHWSRLSPANVGDLAEACDSAERWAHAVHAANP